MDSLNTLAVEFSGYTEACSCEVNEVALYVLTDPLYNLPRRVSTSFFVRNIVFWLFPSSAQHTLVFILFGLAHIRV